MVEPLGLKNFRPLETKTGKCCMQRKGPREQKFIPSTSVNLTVIILSNILLSGTTSLDKDSPPVRDIYYNIAFVPSRLYGENIVL